MDGDTRLQISLSLSDVLPHVIRIAGHAYTPLSTAAGRLLRPLHVEQILAIMPRLQPSTQRQLGRIAKRIDGAAIDVIRRRLRHPVVERRVQAVRAAMHLECVDDVQREMIHIAVEDHMVAQVAAAAALAESTSVESLNVLHELAKGPDNSVRDAARSALSKRLGTNPYQQESPAETERDVDHWTPKDLHHYDRPNAHQHRAPNQHVAEGSTGDATDSPEPIPATLSEHTDFPTRSVLFRVPDDSIGQTVDSFDDAETNKSPFDQAVT
ncbi:MAG: hypothetical protein AAFP69_01525 [Planctomycetota bacterium]